eukprot:11159703-Heterocapsa_arctica.AAC.1
MANGLLSAVDSPITDCIRDQVESKTSRQKTQPPVVLRPECPEAQLASEYTLSSSGASLPCR